MEIISVPLIVSAVFSILEAYKYGVAKTKHAARLIAIIPIIAAAIGAAIGIVLFFAWPSSIAAADAFAALIIGAASGLTATGCNQIYKQLYKLGIRIKDKEDDKNGDSE